MKIVKSLRGASVMGLALALSACVNLKDVDYQWCEDAPVVQEQISLKADALFYFDQGHEDGLLPAGRQELNELAEKLRTGYARIDGIALVGHTDRLGSVPYNQRLSEQRAQTVKQYLQSQGVTAPISAEGRGKSQPVTQGCEGNVATRALIDCLQPDRRVDVTIIGIKQPK
ncbi:Outer membrane protein II [Oligella urethralis]|nr:OmpA family protein [Oligella sp. HMSC05A10]SUA54436.1 Outer membrane protein II [Oligella urethralis]SUA59332.1 Outer membrane protein II [Oligella urethralis]